MTNERRPAAGDMHYGRRSGVIFVYLGTDGQGNDMVLLADGTGPYTAAAAIGWQERCPLSATWEGKKKKL